MKQFAIFSLTAALALGGLTSVQPIQAGMFDMFNPGDWFGGNRDRYYDRYYGGPYGWGGGPYGWGGGPYGWGGGPYGWGGGPYGWGGPYGGYGPGNTIVVTPQGGSSKQAPPQLPE